MKNERLKNANIFNNSVNSFTEYVEQKFIKLAHIIVKRVHIRKGFVRCVAKR